MVRFKAEVRFRFLTAQLADVLEAAARWSCVTTIDVEVNSINDSHAAHAPASLHTFDLAVDLDTVGDRTADLKSLFVFLARVLPPQFDVVFEGDHVHVEYDTRRGEIIRKALSSRG